MDVTISLYAVQTIDGESAETHTQARGVLEQTADGFHLQYTEAQADGGAQVSVNIRDDQTVIQRKGETSSQMLLEPKKRHLCRYETPYGRIILHTVCHTSDFSFADGEGVLSLAYTLEMDGSATEQAIEIRVKEVSPC